jgi:hypothetical protein
MVKGVRPGAISITLRTKRPKSPVYKCGVKVPCFHIISKYMSIFKGLVCWGHAAAYTLDGKLGRVSHGYLSQVVSKSRERPSGVVSTNDMRCKYLELHRAKPFYESLCPVPCFIHLAFW